jgi:hypothetical protein
MNKTLSNHTAYLQVLSSCRNHVDGSFPFLSMYASRFLRGGDKGAFEYVFKLGQTIKNEAPVDDLHNGVGPTWHVP